MKYQYNLKNDVESVLEIKKINIDVFCECSGVSKRTLFYSFSHKTSETVLEKTYSAIYRLGLKINRIKTELFHESKKQDELILYHGSKFGICELKLNGSRFDCDFGPGLYLTQLFPSAISFVDSYKESSIYAFKIKLKDLKVYEFQSDFDWMMTISLNRQKINSYKNHQKIIDIINKIKDADILIGPIADNKMFEVMQKFVDGEITDIQAIHALSASRLGKQFVIKTQKGLDSLVFLDRLYLCKEEKQQSLKASKEQEILIQSKLDFAKRNYRGQGQYIDEVIK